MHDIARAPGGQWHLESLNDLAGLLGGEAVQEARPAPPECDAASGVGRSGAVCGGSGGFERAVAQSWQQRLAHEAGGILCEGSGEN